jgi:hypothetical protein
MKEREEVESSVRESEEHYILGVWGKKNIPALKVRTHCSLALLVDVSLKALRSGLCYEQRREVEQELYSIG